MSRLDLAKLRFGDVLKGDRGDRLMVVVPAGRTRTASAIVLVPERVDHGLVQPMCQVGEFITVYASWDLSFVGDR